MDESPVPGSREAIRPPILRRRLDMPREPKMMANRVSLHGQPVLLGPGLGMAKRYGSHVTRSARRASAAYTQHFGPAHIHVFSHIAT
jgi:hypothetical protein